MTKIFSGTPLSYGTRLPLASALSDGSFFYLTESYTDNLNGSNIARTPGLHLCSFLQDVNSITIGEQVGFGWTQVTSTGTFVSKLGDTMSGKLSITNGTSSGTLNLSAATGPSYLILGNSAGAGSAGPSIISSTNRELSIGLGTSFSADTGGIFTELLKVTSTSLTFLGNTVWHQGNHGAGSTLDADLLDGQQGAFYTSRASHTGTQDIAFTTTGTLPLTRGGTGITSVTPGGIIYGDASSLSSSAAGTAGFVLLSGGAAAPTWIAQSALAVSSASTANNALNLGGVPASDYFRYEGFTLDADTMPTRRDGFTYALNAPFIGPIVRMGEVTYSLQFNAPYITGGSLAFRTRNGDGANMFNAWRRVLTESDFTNWAPSLTGSGANGTWNINITGNSATVGNLAPSSSATGNTLAARDSNGYLYAVYNNQSSPNNEVGSGAISQVLVTNGTDNFLRKTAFSSLASQLVGSFVLKTGDTMSGSLTGTSFTATQAVNSAVDVQVGVDANTGKVIITAGGGSNTGYVQFFAPSSLGGIRQGYIGFSSTGASTDAGTIPYVAGNHSFLGNVITNSNLTVGGATTINSLLTVNNNIVATGNITAYSSDGRLKKNVRQISNAVEKVQALGGFVYDWDLDKCAEVGFKPERQTEHGLIAQEVELVVPDAVAPAPFNNDYKTVRYDRLVALLMAAVNEQQKQIESLVSQVNELKK